MENLSMLIDLGAQNWPNKIAIDTQKKRVTYSQLQKDVDNFVVSCKKINLVPGDRVAIFSPNTYEAIIAIFGTMKSGGVFICIHPDTPISKLNALLKDSNATVLFADEQVVIDQKALPNLRVKICVKNDNEDDEWQIYDDFLANEADQPLERSVQQEIAALIYTSGTTGQPKGIISTHQNMIFSTNAIKKYLPYSSEDKILTYLPFSFDYGLYQLFLAFLSGSTLYIRNTKYLSVEIRNLILKEGITCIPGLRSIFSVITKFEETIFDSVKIVTNTGEHLPQWLISKLKVCFPNAEIILMYGLSECKRVSYLPSKYLDIKPNSVGIPLEGTEVRIINTNGKECKAYEEGELYVSGPHVCRGYWNQEEETNKTFVQIGTKRYLKTGDLFYRDSDAFLYFVGRKDSLIKSKGFRVDPKEIENKVSHHFPEIKEVIAVGVPDHIHGHTIGLYMVPHLNAEIYRIEERVLEYCKGTLEPWSLPKYILLSEKIILTKNGKVDRRGIVQKILEASKEENRGNAYD